MVVQGCYRLILYTPNQDEKRIPIKGGSKCFVPRGTLHGGEVGAGTSTIKDPWRLSREPGQAEFERIKVRTGRFELIMLKIDSARPHKFRPSRMDGGAYGSGTFTPVTTLVWHRAARLCGDVYWDTALLRGQPATRNFGDGDYFRVARGASGHADCLPGDCAANGARGGRNYLCARAGDGNPALPSDKNSFGD